MCESKFTGSFTSSRLTWPNEPINELIALFKFIAACFWRPYILYNATLTKQLEISFC